MKQAVRPLVRLLEEDYSTVIQSYQSAKTEWVTVSAVGLGVLAAVAVFFCWNPVGWAAVGAYGLGGTVGGVAGRVAGSVAHSEWGAEGREAVGKKDRVRERKVSLPYAFPRLDALFESPCAESHTLVSTHMSPYQSFVSQERKN